MEGGEWAQYSYMGDRWIPMPSTLSIRSLVRLLDKNSKVKELIDENNRSWKEDVVHEIFSKDEVELICYIPICLTSLQDRRIWAHTKNGLFSVRIAYHLDMDRKQRAKCEPFTSFDRGEEWKRLWKLHVPG